MEKRGGGGGGLGEEGKGWRSAATLRGHEGSVLACRFNPTGKYVLTCGRDKTLRLWNPFRETQLASYCEHGYEVRGCDASSDSARLASCGGDRQVFFWDVATGKYLRKFRGHDAGGVNCVRFCAENDAVIASGGEDKKLHFWDVRSSATEPVHSEEAGRDAVSDIQTTAKDKQVLVASIDGSVRCYDVRRGGCVVDDIGSPVTNLSVSKDDALMLASCLVRSPLSQTSTDISSQNRWHRNASLSLSLSHFHRSVRCYSSHIYICVCARDSLRVRVQSIYVCIASVIAARARRQGNGHSAYQLRRSYEHQQLQDDVHICARLE